MFCFFGWAIKIRACWLIQVLNNPPEDAPRKPGIFPKTKSGKAVPLPSDNPPTGSINTDSVLDVNGLFFVFCFFLILAVCFLCFRRRREEEAEEEKEERCHSSTSPFR